jgi:hypothetical protein
MKNYNVSNQVSNYGYRSGLFSTVPEVDTEINVSVFLPSIEFDDEVLHLDTLHQLKYTQKT